ncbi:MAG: hypothetical protein IAI50_06715 [Candidatus Eremiobacteraeota bacterium]|nr:hypothetical protein [Candidatus Eremiobacteraeota bacterium]
MVRAAGVVGKAARPALPPMGMYNSCEIDYAETDCAAEDDLMYADGYRYEVNFLTFAAHLTGPNSIVALLTHDSRRILQYVNIKNAVQDRGGVLNGTTLSGTASSPTSIGGDCSRIGYPFTNAGVVSCLAATIDANPTAAAGFAGWYVYDEPGCPNQSIGYCAGTLAGGNYENVQTLAAYIAGTGDTHMIFGVQIPSGVPNCAGGWSGSCAQTQINNLYSCNNQTTCLGNYPWITTKAAPNTGYDYYPIGAMPGKLSPDDVGKVAALTANTFASRYPAETVTYTAQAFSWWQERGGPVGPLGCTSYSVCPFPTTAQIQQLRDQALYYGNAAGYLPRIVFYYYWPDITCNGTNENYPGCNATTNRATVKAAAFAPFPVSAPPVAVVAGQGANVAMPRPASDLR